MHVCPPITTALRSVRTPLHHQPGSLAAIADSTTGPTGRFIRTHTATEPRAATSNQYPSRKCIIFTNLASGGALRNIPKRGDGLGAGLGQLATRNMLTDAAGATAGLVVFGGLHGLGLGSAAINIRRTVRTRISNLLSFKSTLLRTQAESKPSDTNLAAINPCLNAADRSILNHREQRHEAHGLWLATTGSLLGATGRILEAAGSHSILALTAVTGSIVGAGLAGFGLIQMRND